MSPPLQFAVTTTKHDVVALKYDICSLCEGHLYFRKHCYMYYIFFFFFGGMVWHAGSQFPDQGSNPALGTQSLNNWTTRDVRVFFYLNLCILFLVVLGLHCCTQAFSICDKQWLLFIALRWLLLLQSTGSRCTGFGHCSTWAPQLWLTGSVVVVHGLSRPMACGIFPDQGLNPCPLYWECRVLTIELPRTPLIFFFLINLT